MRDPWISVRNVKSEDLTLFFPALTPIFPATNPKTGRILLNRGLRGSPGIGGALPARRVRAPSVSVTAPSSSPTFLLIFDRRRLCCAMPLPLRASPISAWEKTKWRYDPSPISPSVDSKF